MLRKRKPPTPVEFIQPEINPETIKQAVQIARTITHDLTGIKAAASAGKYDPSKLSMLEKRLDEAIWCFDAAVFTYEDWRHGKLDHEKGLELANALNVSETTSARPNYFLLYAKEMEDIGDLLWSLAFLANSDQLTAEERQDVERSSVMRWYNFNMIRLVRALRCNQERLSP